MNDEPIKLPPDICEHLLSKNIVIGNFGADPTLHDPHADEPSEPYWCGLTQEALGPDDEIVAPPHCRAGRSCCVPRGVPRV